MPYNCNHADPMLRQATASGAVSGIIGLLYNATTVMLLLDSTLSWLVLILVLALPLQSSPLSLRREAMQRLLVLLLQQLHGSQTTDDPILQRMLVFGCCQCLHSLHMQPAAPDCVSPP